MNHKFHLISAAAAGALAVSVFAARAQETEAQRNDRLLRQGNITSTGATVPLPGEPKSSGETLLDRHIQQKDDQIQKSICTNC